MMNGGAIKGTPVRLRRMCTQGRWVVLFMWAFSGCVCGRTETRTYSPDGLHYVVAYPDGHEAAPLWVFQPGDGTLRDSFDEHGAKVLASSVAQRLGVVFVFPELRRQRASSDASAYCALDFFHRQSDLAALIDEAKTLEGVDLSRVYLVGHSAGAEIVTLTSIGRADVRGVATYGGGTASLGEMGPLPPDLGRLMSNDCSDPARRWERSGAFWQQLFVDAQLFESIQKVDRPYLALIGEHDETVPWADHEPWGRRLEELEPTFRLESLPGGTHSLLSGPWERMAAFFEKQ
jgi:dienelactone hydrolase